MSDTANDTTPDKIDTLRKKIDTLQTKITKAETAIETAQERLETLEQQLFAFEEELDELITNAPVMPSGFPRVQVGDNWGSPYYTVNDTDLKAGMSVRVAFEGNDKTLDTVIVGKRKGVTVYDMGKASTGSPMFLYINVPNEYGQDTLVELNSKMGLVLL